MNDDTPDRRLARALGPGEEILWSGRPQEGLRLRSSDLFLIPFSLMWCGFVVFWEYMAFRGNAPLAFKFFGIPFVLVGLYLVFGRFFFDALQRGRTRYAVTTERVVLVSGILRPSVESVPLRGLSFLKLTERADGRGDVALGPPSPFGQFMIPGWPGARQFMTPFLDGIPDARRVHDLIRKAQVACA